MKKKKILQVFSTYTDAYLEFKNNFLTKEKFIEFYFLDEKEVDKLFSAVKLCLASGDWRTLDYYYNIQNNTKCQYNYLHH